ncbi:MAG: flagellar basal body rod protein FlgC [Firmicutes bacterium]|nr:flagellar basal body rod protein FlgC [Bacillota bacterium]
MGIFRAIETSASGLTAERLRLDIIANNIANANTTRTAEGGPYRRQMPVFAAREKVPARNGFAFPPSPFERMLEKARGVAQEAGEGVRVVGIIKDSTPPRRVYDPAHPDADAQGYVSMPNLDIVTEMVDMISASRAYEANVTAINEAKQMAMKALEIGRG